MAGEWWTLHQPINKNKIRRVNDMLLSAICCDRILDQTYGTSQLHFLVSSLPPCLQKYNSIYEPFYIIQVHTVIFWAKLGHFPMYMFIVSNNRSDILDILIILNSKINLQSTVKRKSSANAWHFDSITDSILCVKNSMDRIPFWVAYSRSAFQKRTRNILLDSTVRQLGQVHKFTQNIQRSYLITVCLYS